MSWYDANYTRRAMIRVPPGAGADTTLTIPPNWDTFWATVQSTGYDVRFANESGDTLLTYERATWDYANKSGVFEIQGGNAETGIDSFIFLYWGYVSATDVSASVTPTGPTAVVDLMLPVEPIIDAIPDAPGATQPALELAKGSSETRLVTFRIDPRDLLQRREPSAGSLRLEELESASAQAFDADGTTVSMTLSAEVVYAFEDAAGAQYAIVSISSGTDAADYIVEFTANAYFGRYKRIAVKVRDLAAT